MTSPTLKTFYVYFDTWCSFGRTIEAVSDDQAIEQAQKLYGLEGEQAFNVDNAGCEPFYAYEVSEHSASKGGQS
jgi:hypothetical protein